MLYQESRPQTLGEEIANSISHGFGALLALVAAPVLLYQASQTGSASTVTGVSIFLLTMFLLYMTSTLYHAIARNRAKPIFQILDHSAIYLLIAGTYTPFCLGVLKGVWGWSLFVVIWGLAVIGVVLKSMRLMKYPWVSTVLYLVMGWLGVVAAGPLYAGLSSAALIWLAAGGAAYSLGVVFFVLDERVRYAHFTWHLFVLAGSLCHCVAIFFSTV